MSKKTDDVVTRAITWSEKDPDIAGLVLYGSVARGQSHPSSDVDLVIITRTGKRDHIWNKRAKIATHLLDAEIAWSHDLPWQGDYRFQAWRSDLLGIDLTVDDGHVQWHDTFDTGQPTVIAGDVTLPAQTNQGSRRTTPDMEVWVWFLGIHNQLQQDRVWDAYCQLIQLLDTRLRPFTDQTQLATLAPAEATAPAVLEALQAAVHTYQMATMRVQTEQPPMATAIRGLILTATPRFCNGV